MAFNCDFKNKNFKKKSNSLNFKNKNLNNNVSKDKKFKFNNSNTGKKSNNFNKKFKNSSNLNKSSDFENIYKKKFEENFGMSSFNKLINAKNMHSCDVFIRINISRIFPKKIEDFLKKNRAKFSKTFLPNSYKIEKSFFNVSSSLPSLTGEIYLQDLASQIPVNLIDFEKYKGLKIDILDMAASPGSKTTQIADLCSFYNVDCNIVALELEKVRILRLINNISKQGFENINIVNIDAIDFETEKKFDIILLDAPCSGNLVGDNTWLKKRDLGGILKKSNLQKKLIKNAVKLLKDDGILIYSTCSLESEENEENVLWAEKNCNLKSIKSNLNFGFETNSSKIFFDKKLKEKYIKINCDRFQPYLSKTQGFFVCLFAKKNIKLK